jgi:hypothetical protein
MARRVLTLLTLVLVMFVGAGLAAHDDYRVIGTITKFEKSRLDVKTKEAKTVSIAVDKQTVITRDKKKVDATELKMGRSVVVDAWGDSYDDLLAIEVRIVPAINSSGSK